MNKIYFDIIESTHTYAKQLEKKENGIVIIANNQTGGIGTNGRKWYTGYGKNIAMTMVFTPKCNVSKLDGLTIQIAEFMQETIMELYNIKLDIKEPNDLMLNGKKIGGILTEIRSQGKKVLYLLISIGFNVLETDFDEATSLIATSLLKEEMHKEEIKERSNNKKEKNKKEAMENKFNKEKIIDKFIQKIELKMI